MPFLILSDIHANLEALEAVLADAEGRYDSILCLGDLVGYGADPNAVIEWARKGLRAVVRGNHDKACSGLDPAHVYNPAARMAIAWTREQLTPESQQYLSAMPRGPLRIIADGTAADGAANGDGGAPVGNPSPHWRASFDLSHGSPLDEDEYLISIGDASLLRPDLEAGLTFFGHTHVQGGFLLTRRNVARIPATKVLQIEPQHVYLVNPGSVGQPRDRNPLAAYAIYDPDARTVEFRRVGYDVDRAARKIINAGLPDLLAARLYEGM